MLPLRGVDGLEAAWPAMLDAFEAGAEWASKERYAFAKDFGGSYLCVDMGTEIRASGCIIRIEDDEITVVAKDMESFLETIANELETGEVTIADTVEHLESFEVVFDAARRRTPGDVVTHSVLTQLHVEATVEGPEVHASRRSATTS
jgi:hypothetical protein